MIGSAVTRQASWILVAAVLTACGSPPKTSFYTLDATPSPASIAPDVRNYGIVVGPVTLPEMVDRPQLVVRVSANQVTVLDNHRWAEPLKSVMPRIIAADLSRLLGVSRVRLHPQSSGAETEYRVRVDVQRFESDPGKGVTLEAYWSVQRKTDIEARGGRSLVHVPVAEAGYDALAAAHSRAMERLSEELAEVIRSIRRS